MNPMYLSTTTAETVAYASSETDGGDRWTELRVFWYPDPKTSRPWLAEIRGKSSIEGEQDKVRRLNSRSLARVLRFFEPSDLARSVTLAAQEFAEDMGLPLNSCHQQVPTDATGALAWLLGVDPADLKVRVAAKALGMGESTMRQAIAAGREVKVPLQSLLPFVDRAAFQRAVAGSTSRENDNG